LRRRLDRDVGGGKNFIATGGKAVTMDATAMTTSFGQLLSAAREQRGLSIADAAHETRIPAQRLRYLESGNFAAFGSMTYARSFIRQYSDFLDVDATAMLAELPEGVLGGERDYRYLTRSHGAWLRDRDAASERITAPSSRRTRSIKSPLAESQRQIEPAALKALPFADDTAVPLVQGQPLPVTAAQPAKQVMSVRKTTLVD
jgi:transcriptional regulator with XRE-family HTH domain